MTKSAGGSSYPYVYKEDPKGRLAEIDNPFGQTFGFSYDASGNLVAKSFQNGEKDAYAYDPTDRISEIDYYGPPDDNGSRPLKDSLTYVRDATGRITSETGANPAWTHTYAYDDLHRLTQESYPPLFGTESYAYDKDGNRIEKIVGADHDRYYYDNADKLSWINRNATDPSQAPSSGQSSPYAIYTYGPIMTGMPLDEKPHVEERVLTPGATPIQERYTYYEYRDDLLQSVLYELTTPHWTTLDSTTDLYDVLGQRTEDYDGWVDNGYAVNGSDRWGPEGLYRRDEYHSDGTHDSYVYTEGLGHRLIPASGQPTDRYYHSDAQGSVRFLSDASGVTTNDLRYDAFGAMKPRTPNDPPTAQDYNPTPFQYDGEWGYQRAYRPGDANNPGLDLLYVGARYYDYNTGRFISPDPIGLAGGLNRYVYCDDDPVNCVDPSGMGWRKTGLGILGGLIGGSIGNLGGAAIGVGLGTALGSYLEGESPGQAAFAGLSDAAITYVGGKACEYGIQAYRGWRAARIATEAAGEYEGVRAASEYLKQSGLSREVRKQVLESFERDTISVRAAGENEFGLRYFDNVNAQAKGRFLFDTFPASRESLAVKPEWNEMTNITQWQIQPGSIFIEGRAVGQGLGLGGGQIQKYVLNLGDLLIP